MDFSRNPYFTEELKISTLQRWVLVHSFLYYDLNYNVVSDHVFDDNCKQLYQLKLKRPRTYKGSRYGYAMQSFDGSTGYGFHALLTEEHRLLVERDAYHLKERY